MRNKWKVIIATLLLFATVISTLHAEDEEKEKKDKKTTVWDVLAFPQKLVELSFYPAKKLLIFAERVDLPARITDFFYNDKRTAAFLPNFAIDGEYGTGGGLSVFHKDLFHRGKQVNASFLFVSDEDRVVKFLYKDPSIFQGPFHYGVRFLFAEDSDEDFFVRHEGSHLITGNRTREDDETSFELDLIEPEFFFGISPLATIQADLFFTASFGKVEGGTGEGGPIPAEIEGVGDDVDILGEGIQFEWDRRNSSFRPTQGTYLNLKGGIFQGINGQTSSGKDYGYTQYQIDLQEFIPLFAPCRTLVVRGSLEKLNPLSEEAIPFYKFPVLDKNNALRGFDRKRFTDEGALLFNVEYRYPIWDTWEGVLFLDEGQVFKKYNNITPGEFHYSAGTGVRITTKDSFLFNLQTGFSDEGTEFLLQLEQEF